MSEPALAAVVFSFTRSVGPSTRSRGYLPALEFRDGQTVTAVGGGLCQLANLIVLLGIEAGLEIVERHRHSLDLFPDAERTAPFGCGATVFSCAGHRGGLSAHARVADLVS